MPMASEIETAGGERPMPKHIRRSILFLSLDDPGLEEKAFASWASAGDCL